METIYTIDATGGKFTQKRFNIFCSYIKDETANITVVFDDILENCAFNTFKQFLMSDTIVKAFTSKPNDICAFACDDAELIVDTNSVIWWLKQKGGVFTRLDRLFSDVKLNCASSQVTQTKAPKATKSDNKKQLNIAAGIIRDTEVTDLDIFEGDNKACVAFINEYYAKAIIRSKFKALVKFVIDYQNEDELCVSTNWKTIDELELEGVIKTK